MTIEKRDGEIVEMDRQKIYDSISNANLSVEADVRLTKKQIDRITDSVVAFCETMDEPIKIDDLEDLIERKIFENNGYEVGKRYITYRYEKERVRFNKSLTEKLTASNVQNQNANVDEFSFGGRIGETASYVTRDYAFEHLISKKAKRNHANNEIYIHDSDHVAIGDHNCLSVPFDSLLANGFNTRQGDVRPAGSINTAFQLVAVLFQIQSLQQFGGVSATHLDWTMVPYVRKSFRKHYLDGMRYIVTPRDFPNVPVEETMAKIVIDDTTPIDAEIYKLHKDAYKYAIDQTNRELNQAVEGMYHNLNTLQSRSGCQLPFTSINYGTCTVLEGRMVIKALLEGSIKGIGKFGRTPIFPCGIFQMMKGVNRKPGDPNYDLFRLALKSTALRLYPNYCSCDWSVDNDAFEKDREARQKMLMTLSAEQRRVLAQRISANSRLGEFLRLVVNDNGDDVCVDKNRYKTEFMSTMGCRTYNGYDVNFADSFERNVLQVIDDGTLYDNVESGVAKDGRGNICPVTIILPTLAMHAVKKVKCDKCKDKCSDNPSQEDIYKCQVEAFMKILDKKIDEAKDMLLERFDWICSQPMKSARFMYENSTMLGYRKEAGIKSALRHGTLAIGQLGLAETLQILIGCDQTADYGMEVAKRIEALYKEKCAKFKKEYSLNFGVYFTPAENLCFTAKKKWDKAYGKTGLLQNSTFFTNSMHVPVWHKMTPFQKIDLESQLTGYSSAGCITYVELDATTIHNIDALETLVNYAMDKDIPYFAINVPNDICVDCGHQGEINDVCPKCGSSHVQRLRRVTGYLTGDYKTAFNPGKQQEVEKRVHHCSVEI